MCALAGPLRMVEAGARAFACDGAVGVTAPLAGPDDCVASVEIVPACGREEDRIHLSGPQYAIEMWTPLSYRWRIRIWENGALVKDEEASPEAPYIESAGVYGETAAFLSAVREGTDPRPNLSDAMPGSELAAQLQAVVDQSILPTD